MAVITTTTLSNSIIARYRQRYEPNVKRMVAYDQLATPWANDELNLQRLSSANFVFLSEMDPAVTAIPQNADVVPETLVDATASVTPTSRYGVIQASLQLMLTNYPGYGAQRITIIENNAAEGIDLLAQAAALGGGVVVRAAARASLDAGGTGHQLSEANISKAELRLSAMKCPQWTGIKGDQQGMWFALMPDEAYYDLLSGGNIQSISQYQDKNIIVNRELGNIGKFKLIVPDWPKVLGGAGADNATNIDTTLGAAATKMDKTITVASASNMAVGQTYTIGTEETSTTFYPDNERVTCVSVSGTTIGVAGSGSNGGLRYDHVSGAGVRNADSVYPVIYGGPESLVKMYAPQVGEFGDVVLKEQGLLNQFSSVGWLFFGNYGLIAENRIVRGEYSSAADA